MKKPIHVLHIEDSGEDSELAKARLLAAGLDCEFKRIQTRDQVFDQLQRESFDLILADCKLPGFSGLHALEIAHALKPEIPFVFYSGTIGEETAIESLRNGATDYVLKDNPSRLVPAIQRALAEAEERILVRQLQSRMHETGRLEAISTLADGVAHDFNNILAIIMGHASMLAAEKSHPERVVEISGTIMQAGRRGAEIVQHLMAFARHSDGRGVTTDLNRAVRENLAGLKKKVSPSVEIAFESAASLPYIQIDAVQLERILFNLVNNSVESMPEGGKIVVSTHAIVASRLTRELPGLARGTYACLKVSDTGLGMDATTREHVFEPFFTTKARGRGTGLGLPVVYGLMQALNGSIQVESQPGKGTVVSLFFPAASGELARGKAASPGLDPDPAMCGSETILVVEDEPDISYFLETILQSHGYTVLTARDRDQALELFLRQQQEIRLVFSDVEMPNGNGIALCSELRQRKPDLPVIMASGYSSRRFREDLRKLHSDFFLSKPFHTDEILRCVRKALDRVKASVSEAQ